MVTFFSRPSNRNSWNISRPVGDGMDRVCGWWTVRHGANVTVGRGHAYSISSWPYHLRRWGLSRWVCWREWDLLSVGASNTWWVELVLHASWPSTQQHICLLMTWSMMHLVLVILAKCWWCEQHLVSWSDTCWFGQRLGELYVYVSYALSMCKSLTCICDMCMMHNSCMSVKCTCVNSVMWSSMCWSDGRCTVYLIEICKKWDLRI